MTPGSKDAPPHSNQQKYIYFFFCQFPILYVINHICCSMVFWNVPVQQYYKEQYIKFVFMLYTSKDIPVKSFISFKTLLCKVFSYPVLCWHSVQLVRFEVLADGAGGCQIIMLRGGKAAMSSISFPWLHTEFCFVLWLFPVAFLSIVFCAISRYLHIPGCISGKQRKEIQLKEKESAVRRTK